MRLAGDLNGGRAQVDHPRVGEGEGDGRELVGAVGAALQIDVVEERQHVPCLPHERKV